MRNKKKIIIGTLLTLICIMVIAYARLAQQLQVIGNASIESTWDIRITNITEKEKSIGASSKTEPAYTATTANFNSGFTSPGDYIIYEVEISNLGTLDAIVDSINVSNSDNSTIKYTISEIKKNNKLVARSKKVIAIKIEYRDIVYYQTENRTSNLTLTINFKESLGDEETSEVAEDITIERAEYAIGDEITIFGSKWYVIEDSDYDKDYIVLLKDKILTRSELGSYSYSSTSGGYGLMRYLDSGTCASAGGYVNSNIKPFLEDVYSLTIDPD